VTKPNANTLLRPGEELILRGLHLLMRASFAPNDQARQAKHFLGIQADLGPWFADYADVMKEHLDAALAVAKERGSSEGTPEPGTAENASSASAEDSTGC
jgi:hypothetical protein